MNKILILLLICHISQAEQQIPLLENSRMNFDISSRVSYNERAKETSYQQFLGLELYKVFTFNSKDVGSLLLQPYFHRIDNGVRTPGYYDDRHDWEFIYRTFAFTYTGLGNKFPWVRVGHFEVPFGVEYTKNTFGDLHQYGQNRKLGLKMDWGLAIGQELASWQYEFSVLRGSGLKYRDRQQPYAFSGRVATLDDTFWSSGLSLFHGEILKGKLTQKRELIAWDFQYYYETYGLLLELYTGNINEFQTYGGLIEINWFNNNESLELYSQYQFQHSENDSDYAAIISGISYKVTRNITLSAQATFELDQINSNMRTQLFEFQCRYNF